MPGYANWATLYGEEFRVLTEEGYDTASAVQPHGEEAPLPFPDQKAGEVTPESEAFWQEAYQKLWAIREKGLRADYPYAEPETLEEILEAAAPAPALLPLSEEAYRSRLAGAVWGRIVGVILGKPLEMGWSREKLRAYLESLGEYPLRDYVSGYSEKLDIRLREDCIPSTRGHVAYIQSDDDIHYTLLALLLAEKKGFRFTQADVGENWLDNCAYHWFWCASRQAYYHMVNLREDMDREAQIARIPTWLNPWRECIDGQIRCDLWGYISPCDLREAARMAYTDCSFSLTKNGCYGGMFVAGCIAAALSEAPTVDTILDGGLSVIPAKSRLAEAVKLVREDYRRFGDWEPVCREIEQRCAGMAFADTLNNLSMVVLSLLHGRLDYERTITTAICCGIDTDCNGGTAGSICGAAVGISGIDPRWIHPLGNSIHSAVANFGQGTVTDLIDRIAALCVRHRGESR